MSTQPLNPLDQFFCALLDFSKRRVVVGGEGSFFGGRIVVPRARDGIAKPSHRRLVRCGDASEF